MQRSLSSFEMLSPKNFLSSGRATALFASLTFSFEPAGHEPAHGGHDPFAGAATANVDVAVIGIAAEAEASADQFLIEIVDWFTQKTARFLRFWCAAHVVPVMLQCLEPNVMACWILTIFDPYTFSRSQGQLPSPRPDPEDLPARQVTIRMCCRTPVEKGSEP
jgi:hypothetical protein